jgi:hypothetical protein
MVIWVDDDAKVIERRMNIMNKIFYNPHNAKYVAEFTRALYMVRHQNSNGTKSLFEEGDLGGALFHHMISEICLSFARRYDELLERLHPYYPFMLN